MAAHPGPGIGLSLSDVDCGRHGRRAGVASVGRGPIRASCVGASAGGHAGPGLRRAWFRAGGSDCVHAASCVRHTCDYQDSRWRWRAWRLRHHRDTAVHQGNNGGAKRSGWLGSDRTCSVVASDDAGDLSTELGAHHVSGAGPTRGVHRWSAGVDARPVADRLGCGRVVRRGFGGQGCRRRNSARRRVGTLGAWHHRGSPETSRKKASPASPCASHRSTSAGGLLNSHGRLRHRRVTRFAGRPTFTPLQWKAGEVRPSGWVGLSSRRSRWSR